MLNVLQVTQRCVVVVVVVVVVLMFLLLLWLRKVVDRMATVAGKS